MRRIPKGKERKTDVDFVDALRSFLGLRPMHKKRNNGMSHKKDRRLFAESIEPTWEKLADIPKDR